MKAINNHFGWDFVEDSSDKSSVNTPDSQIQIDEMQERLDDQQEQINEMKLQIKELKELLEAKLKAA